MKVKNLNKMSDQNKNKILSLLLILLISFLCSFFYSSDSNGEKLITTIPIFTILFSLYVYAYGLKKIWAKILFTLLIIASIIVLSLIWCFLPLC
ncbi:ABC-type phosphate/phosphonate transport system permease subunit [Flavobacterium sp. HSC-32F16]|nr:ABC-type phosphate/phosphonate transport system permease subunit [Flavobacterium sp. HSC-32F16]